MVTRIVVVSLLVLSSTAITQQGIIRPKPANNHSAAVRTHTIDLDQPASQRWNSVALEYKSKILPVIAWVKTQIPTHALPALEWIGSHLEKHLPAPYVDELSGISKVLGVSVADVLALNLYYDLKTSCTSIVAAHSNGTVFHGRNLDYGVPGLQAIAADVIFTHGQQLLYRGTTYIGYVGLLTGVRPGGFSVSIDERDTKNGTVWNNAIEAFLKGGHSIGFFLRDLLEQQSDFGAALELMQSAPLIAPSYLIIGGTQGRGAIVTRERSSAVDTWRIDSASGRWFLVETNDDHWKPPNDIRRDAANAHMNASSPEALSCGVMDNVMSSYPNLNDGTTYTTVLTVDGGVYKTLTRNN